MTRTTNLNLCQFEANDTPKWLQDYNGDMEKIDAAVAAKLTKPTGDASQVLNGIGNPITPTATPANPATNPTDAALPFTAGGAFTELAKKENIAELIFDNEINLGQSTSGAIVSGLPTLTNYTKLIFEVRQYDAGGGNTVSISYFEMRTDRRTHWSGGTLAQVRAARVAQLRYKSDDNNSIKLFGETYDVYGVNYLPFDTGLNIFLSRIWGVK